MRNLTIITVALAFGACSSNSKNGGEGGASGGAHSSGGTSNSAGPSSASRSAVGGETGSGGASQGGTSTGPASSTGGTTGSTGGDTGTVGTSSRKSTSGGTTATAVSSAGFSSGGQTGIGGTGGSSGPMDAGPQGDAMVADALKPTAADASDAGSTTTCPAGLSAPSAGNRKVNLPHGGKSRSTIVHVPSGLSAGKPLAVVFDLHGAGGSGSGQQGQSGWGATADREKFLMVYPDGIDGYWNVDDTCCGTAGKQKIDDVGFLKAVIAQLNKDFCVDAKRIYVTGWSNGGGLTHRMGCDAADVIAAIAPVATDLRTQPCKPVRPISMMEIRPMADSVEPYEGGVVGPAGGQYVDVGAKASQKLWADMNQCSGTTTTMDKYCENYTTCQGGVETDLCSLPGVDHSPYGNNLGFNVADVAWKMFQRQPMK